MGRISFKPSNVNFRKEYYLPVRNAAQTDEPICFIQFLMRYYKIESVYSCLFKKCHLFPIFYKQKLVNFFVKKYTKFDG